MNTSPWRWVPSLYFAQGIPYVVVMTLSVILYKNLGFSRPTSWP
jgi:PAT family beta-lactamase induction signal transducer AmpG